MIPQHTAKAIRRAPLPVFWGLRGPRAFLDRITEKLSSVRFLVVLIPAHGPEGLEARLDKHLAESTYWKSKALRIAGGSTALAQLAGALKLERGSEAKLLSDGSGSQQVFVLSPADSGAFSRIGDLARELKGTQGPRFIVVADHGHAWQKLKGEQVGVLEWQGVLHASDINLYAAHLFERRSAPHQTRLLENLVVEMGGADIGLQHLLCELGDSELLDIESRLKAMVDADRQRYSQFSIEHGTLDSVDGIEWRHPLATICAAMQAQSDDPIKAVSHQLWRAQVRSLMPWYYERIEAMMKPLQPWIRLIDAYDGFVPREGEARQEPREPSKVRGAAKHVSWKHNIKFPDWHRLIGILDKIVSARNNLAHGDRLTPQEVNDFLESVQQLINFRPTPESSVKSAVRVTYRGRPAS